MFAWLRRRERRVAARPDDDQPVWVSGAPAEPEPQPEPEPEPEPVAEPVVEVEVEAAVEEPAGLNRDGAQAVLEDTLEALGSAHHRPFSRG